LALEDRHSDDDSDV